MRRILLAIGLVLGLTSSLVMAAQPVGAEPAPPVDDGSGLRFVDLGTLGGPASRAYAVNDHGEVVGSSDTTASSGPHAFLWRRGRMIDLGTLAGPDGFSVALDINNRGEVVGFSGAAGGFPHAFLWRDGVMTDLSTAGERGSEATAINDHGDVVGLTIGEGLQQEAVIWRDGEATSLGSFGGHPLTQANDINKRGQVVATNPVGPALWEDGVVTAVEVPADAEVAVPNAINDGGNMAGYSVLADTFDSQATLWDDGTPRRLGTLGGRHSSANGINKRDHVVGWSFAADESTNVAFVWKRGRMTALPLPDDYLHSEATDINDAGLIVGVSTRSADGLRRAVLWK